MPRVSRKSLLAMEEEERQQFLAGLSKTQADRIRWYWDVWSRPQQRAPEGDWQTWLLLAGRGFGKTRAGAEWVREMARRHPEARIALIASSLGEARRVMVEGESGLLAIARPEQRPLYESSLRKLTWPNGAQAQLYSAAEAESLRGPQHSHAWCDEVAKWDAAKAEAAWDNLMMGLRLGEHPCVVATTTPRAVPLVTRLLAGADGGTVAVTRGSTYDNAANLPLRFVAANHPA